MERVAGGERTGGVREEGEGREEVIRFSPYFKSC